MLRKTIAKQAELLNKYFPNAVVIPTVGNNDNKIHDYATFGKDKVEFYNFLYNEWITKMEGNARLRDDKSLKETFMNGAYYRVDMTDKISILALNTMYYMFSEDKPYTETQMTEEGTAQLKWMEH